MTIPVTDRRAGPFTGNDSTDTFPFSFAVDESDELRVVHVDEDGNETDWTLDSDYTVTLNSDQANNPGGTVDAATALPTGEQLVILGLTPVSQPTRLPGGGDFRADTIEGMVDRVVKILQEQAEIIGRALVLSIASDVDNVSNILPEPEAGKILGWNNGATGLANYDVNDFTSIAAYGDTVVESFAAADIDGETYVDLSEAPASINDVYAILGGQLLTPGDDFTLSGLRLTPTYPFDEDEGDLVVRFHLALPHDYTGLVSSKTHDFDGTDGATTTLTVVGAVVGDDVNVTWTDATADVVVRGYVSAADTVTLVKTGAGNPGSLSYLVRVFNRG